MSQKAIVSVEEGRKERRSARLTVVQLYRARVFYMSRRENMKTVTGK